MHAYQFKAFITTHNNQLVAMEDQMLSRLWLYYQATIIIIALVALSAAFGFLATSPGAMGTLL